VRRDTHDDRVPAQIFEVLPFVLASCPNLQYIIFERLGTSLGQSKEQGQFRKDFRQLKSVVCALDHSYKTPRRTSIIPYNQQPLNDEILYGEQQFITHTINSSRDPDEAFLRLKRKELADWKIECWNPSMLETAIRITKKWD
jgi:hypothetical protein